MRIFVALFLPEVVKQAVAAAVERLRSPGDGVSWVKAENLHYTLRFLGELGEDGVRRVGEAAAEAAAAHAPFEMSVGGFGCFPPRGVPRVLWVGAVSGGAELEAVARDLEQGLRRRGFERADHPFRAHLTVGRVRDWRPRARGGPPGGSTAPGAGGSGAGEGGGRDWQQVLAAATISAPAFRVERIGVVHSTLSPKGSIYRVLQEALLRAPAT